MLNIRKNKGFTLVEAIIALALLSIISVACLGVLTSALSSKMKSADAIKEHVALRQTVLTVTREIRKDPEAYDTTAKANSHYNLVNNVLTRTNGAPSIAKDIEGFSISVDNGKAQIYIKSTKGQDVTTTIHLRIGI